MHGFSLRKKRARTPGDLHCLASNINLKVAHLLRVCSIELLHNYQTGLVGVLCGNETVQLILEIRTFGIVLNYEQKERKI